MSNTRIGKLVKDIQYVTDFRIEQVADKIGYTRPHLNRLMKKGDSRKVYDALQHEFAKELQNVQNTPTNAQEAAGSQKSQNTAIDTKQDKVQTVTSTPSYGVKSNGKDLTIIQAEALKENAVTLRSQQELISDLAKNVMHLSGRLIGKK